jgi:ferredoxin
MMTTINVRARDGSLHQLEGRDGNSLMEVIRVGGLDELAAMCGGSCSCATCHIYVGEGFAALVPPLSDDEDELLDGSDHRQAGSRLACQLQLSPELAGMEVTIAPED